MNDGHTSALLPAPGEAATKGAPRVPGASTAAHGGDRSPRRTTAQAAPAVSALPATRAADRRRNRVLRLATVVALPILVAIIELAKAAA
jgi:hypothetical protein